MNANSPNFWANYSFHTSTIFQSPMFHEFHHVQVEHGQAEAILEAALQRSVAASCEGLMATWPPKKRQKVKEIVKYHDELSWNITKHPMEIHGVSLVIVIDFKKDSKDLFPCFLFLSCFWQVKHLDSIYEPSTKRSDCWLKLKKAPT